MIITTLFTDPQGLAHIRQVYQQELVPTGEATVIQGWGGLDGPAYAYDGPALGRYLLPVATVVERCADLIAAAVASACHLGTDGLPEQVHPATYELCEGDIETMRTEGLGDQFDGMIEAKVRERLDMLHRGR